MPAANNAISLQGATPGILNLPKKSNVLSGLSLNSKQSVPNPITGGGQPKTIQTPKVQAPQGAPIPPGSFSGLGNTSLTPNTSGTSPVGNIAGMLNQPKPKNVLDNFGSGNKDVKSITQPDGTKIDLYSDNKTTGGTSSPSTSPTPTPKPTTITTSGGATLNADGSIRTPANQAPVGNTVGTQIGNVANTGPQTDLERERFARLDQAGQMTPQEEAANREVARANELQKAYQNVGALSPYAEAGLYSDRARSPEEIQAIQQAPDLAGRAASTQGLTNSLSNIYGSSRVAGANAALQGIQTAAGRGLSAAQSGLGAAQTQAGRAQSAANTVLGAVAPQYGISYGTQVGQPGLLNGGISQDNLGGIAAPSNIRAIQDYTSQINMTQKSIDTLKGLGSAIAPNMGTVGFNPTSSPIGNDTFQKYYTEKNPAAKAGLVAGLGEIKNQISNVIASATGLTPTGVTAVADTYDLSTLNPQQLNDFLLYIDKYAQINMEAANKSIDRIKSGGSVDANIGVLPVPEENSTGQAALGTGATVAKGFISEVLSKAGSAASGFLGGIASKILQ